ncbi:MAG: hypothetical protein ACREFY_11640 [Acetobacteraceae bacterium]
MNRAVITTIAGTGDAGCSGDGGPALAARLNGPFDLAFDPAGRLVFADTFNHRVRRIDLGRGTIETVAGSGTAGFAGDAGPATLAQLREPYGIAIGADGALFIVDRLNRRVRRVDPATGIIATIAGDGRATSDGDDGPATAAGLMEPNDACLDRTGARLFIADVAGHRVRVVDLATGRIATFAGIGAARDGRSAEPARPPDGVAGPGAAGDGGPGAAGDGGPGAAGDGGPAHAAALYGPRAVALAADGALLILERNGCTLRRVDPATGIITTIAGNGTRGAGGDGGPARAAEFAAPKELGIDRSGGILVVDTETHRIRRIDPSGIVTTIAGTGVAGSADGPAATACLARPHGVAVGPDGAVYIGDTENHRIRRLDRIPPARGPA